MLLSEPFFVFIVGLVFGSFVTCVAHRLPIGEDIVRKPSYCPSCETGLTFYDLWPVFSWMLSCGRCSHCKSVIPLSYPLIEIATGILFLLAYFQFGLVPQTFVIWLMSVALMVMIVVDLEHFIIPDSVHLVLIPLAVAYHYFQAAGWQDALSGMLLMAALALFLHYGYSALRGRVMLGFGDVKFFTIAGLWLGLWPLVPFLFFSGILGVILGLVWRRLGRGEVFPFGPALALSLYVCVLYQDHINILYYIHKLFN